MVSKFYNPIKTIKLDKEFSEWFGIWIGDGDRSIKRGTVGLASQCEEVLKFNIKILTQTFGLDKNRIKCEITTNDKDLNKIKRKWANTLKIPENRIGHIQYNRLARRDCARVFVYSNLLLRDLLNFEDLLINKISKGSKNIKSSFVNGIFAAEGNMRLDDKCARIGMKNDKVINFVKNLLSDLGIKTTVIYNTYTKALELCIFGYDNLVKFNQVGGFGKHTSKNNGLNMQLESYENKLPWGERFRRLNRILIKKGTITSVELKKMMNLSSANAGYILRKFHKEGGLLVDKSNKSYIYSINK